MHVIIATVNEPWAVFIMTVIRKGIRAEFMSLAA